MMPCCYLVVKEEELEMLRLYSNNQGLELSSLIEVWLHTCVAICRIQALMC